MRVARLLNGVALLAVVAGEGASLFVPGAFGRLLAGPDLAPGTLIGLRLLLAIGIVMAVSTDRLLAALEAIVATAARGDPFAPDNARWLRAAGLALLVLQLLDLPCALLARGWPALGAAAPAGGVSLGGWMATLLLFVLARVFAAGAEMRDEVAGTV